MKRQLSDSDENLSNKLLTKNKTSTLSSFYSTNQYCIYWFDEFHSDLLKHYNINLSKLRAIIDYLEIFDQFDQYERTLRQTIETRVFIVVNASISIKVLNLFDKLEQIHSIYIYKDNEIIDPSLINEYKTYTKFQGIFDNPNEVFDKLSKTIRIYTRHSILGETSALLLAVSDKVERTTGLHSQIERMNWFTYLYDVLEEISPSKNGKERFVQECRNRYRDNPSILRAVEEFNENYDSQKAIWWYTREGFLFRLINRALRQQDQNDILLIHFFIHDLAQQLKIESNGNKDADWMNEHLYRGQLMSIDEIKFIERRKQHTLYVNTFLSTSTDLDLVKMFAGAGSNDLDAPFQSVIFDIAGEISGGPSEKSVADIHHLSFSNEENEILFSPSYTFMPNEVIYDRNDKVWNIHLHRIIDAYDLRMEFDQRLIKLDVLIRVILEEADSSISNESIHQNEEHLYLTFTNDITLLLQQLNEYKSLNITLNFINEKDKIKEVNERISPFELTAIRTFVERSLNQRYKISSLLVTTLNDCLANIYKQNGKYHLAFEHFHKSITCTNNEEKVRTTFTRKVNLAQTHKLVGDYAAAWTIFEELEKEDLTELFIYERLFRDIALDISSNNNITLDDKLQNCFDYLEYASEQADLDEDGFIISEVYVELGQMYLYHSKNYDKAILCFNRDLQIRRISHPDESIGFGPNYERLADAYAFLNTEKALENYEKAIVQYSLHGNSSIIDIALCWCKLGRLHNEHQVEPFKHALTLILSINDQDYQLNKDEIASCLLHLAKSCARCELVLEMALEICQTIFRLYPYEPDTEPGINNDFNECIELILILYQKKKHDGSIVPTKEEILKTWKCSSSMNNDEIVQLLISIQQKLNSTTIENN